jgi:hypothetical protein
MRRTWKCALYTTDLVSNPEEGWSAVQLHKRDGDKSAIAARVAFWDAEGQFSLEAFCELPLEIVEELIAEARAAIKTE